jgi:predicted metal-binding membrane protein
MPAGDVALAALLKRDRAIVLAALGTVAVLAWAYLLWLASTMNPPAMPADSMAGMDAMMAPEFAPWTVAHFLFVFAMWAVMMVGMMLPSVSPTILIYTQFARQSRTLGTAFKSSGWFVLGYLCAWTAFAFLAALGQYALEYLALLSPMMVSTSRMLGGAILIAAGLYQWTPLKTACLSSCRAPLAFVQRHGGFKPDAFGSLRLGVLHGLYCVGCCWALMALLFVGGVMNVLWIAGLMIFVLLEKILPGGQYLSRAAGLAAFAAGIWLLAG